MTAESLPIMLESNLASKIRRIYKSQTANTEILDIITFAESKSGLDITLYPAQRFILKVFYLLPLSDNLPDPIIIRDEFNENIIHTFKSEIEFFNFLYKEKRINLSYETYLQNIDEGIKINEAIFVCGRRASKTTLTSVIVCYTLYRLLTIYNPHEFFGVMRTDPIGIALVSNLSRSASRTFNAVSDFIKTSKFFSRFIGGQYANELWLTSESFKQEEIDNVIHTTPGNILITSYSANAGVRGASNIIFVLDEVAHFLDAAVGAKDQYLDEKIYEAIQPSIFGFRDPTTHKSEGVGFLMSSPNGKKGILYDFYLESFSRRNTIMIHTPSHWINNNIASDELRRNKDRSELAFKQEVLAQFLDQETNWITDINRLDACFNHANKNECQQRDNYIRFAGFDLALSNDNSVLAIGHYQQNRPEDIELDQPSLLQYIADDNEGYYIIDYVHIWQPTPTGDINIDQLIIDLDYIFQRFNVKTGSYDQFSHAIFTQMLEKRPNIKMTMHPANQSFNSEKAMLTKRLINEGRLLMPNIPFVRNEWRTLQESVAKNGYIKVANDTGHDDSYSAISTALYWIFTNSGVLKREAVVNTTDIQQRNIIKRTATVSIGRNTTRTSQFTSGGRIPRR